MIETWFLSFANDFFKWPMAAVIFAFACISVCHAIIYKDDSRSAVGWVAFILAAPFIGALTYVLFGFNRIKKKGEKLNSLVKEWESVDCSNMVSLMEQKYEALRPILKSGDALGFSPLSQLEDITPLNTGDEAYPKMLEAIDQAQTEIKLFSYIFKFDITGIKFLEALERAQARGVSVLILFDGVGSQETILKLKKELTKRQLIYDVFLPIIWRPWFVNLRNHRKILVIDSHIAFTGGLNIAEVYWPKFSTKEKILDFHFLLKGSIAFYIEQVFNDDWYFCTGKQLGHSPAIEEVSKVSEHFSRVVASGPGKGKEKIQWHFISAINAAKDNVRILTPYFLPSSEVLSALIAACHRGVRVDIVIPGISDHPVITWALKASMYELMSSGCHIWFSSPPFDHSKLLLIDNYYCSVGSGNWDARSLRLNFEMNVEIIGLEINQKLVSVFESKKSLSQIYSLELSENRNILEKIRDGIARMLTPYL